MRPNLSFEKFASVLAALGTSAIVACGGSQAQPAHATEVVPAAPGATGQASCSASGCGGKASPDGKTGAAAAPAPTTAAAMTPATDVAAPSTASAAAQASSDGGMGAASTSAAAPAGKPPVAKAAATPKKAGSPKGAPAGEASCGAGTCSGDAKKKIL
jgi:hypothetical protein